MPLKTPSQYLRTRSHDAYNRKPTAATLVSSKGVFVQPQLQSPLLRLPAEILQEIYTYALLSYPDLSRPYSPHTFYYRPTLTHVSHITTALLLTCRRVYLETYLLPLEINEHVMFGCEGSHAPPNLTSYLGTKDAKGGLGSKNKGRSKKLRKEQRDAVKRVTVFAQQYWLEDFNGRKGGWGDFLKSWSPNLKGDTASSRRGSTLSEGTGTGVGSSNGLRELRVTVRHTDWWYYLLGSSSPLALDPLKAGRAKERLSVSDRRVVGSLLSRADTGDTGRTGSESSGAVSTAAGDGISVSKHSICEPGSWGSHFESLHGLQTFELELETLTSKQAELEEVVAVASSWRFKLGDGKILMLDEAKTQRYQWKGSAWFKGHEGGTPGMVQYYDFGSRTWSWRPKLGGGRTDGQNASVQQDFRRAMRNPAEEINRVFAGTHPGYQRLEYYVVVLTWTARRAEEVGDFPGLAEQNGAASRQVSEASTTTTANTQAQTAAPTVNAIHPMMATGTARAVGRNVIPSYWG